jgi:hypothetical protein
MKQKTDRWLQLRKESRVTGSTLFRAFGLTTLREQQEHFDCVYHGIERPISDKLQSFFDYGTREELNDFFPGIGHLNSKATVLFFSLVIPVPSPLIIALESPKSIISQPSSMYVSCGKYTGTIFPSNVHKAFNSSLVP